VSFGFEFDVAVDNWPGTPVTFLVFGAAGDHRIHGGERQGATATVWARK
jgi:hypothetical protein